jgi:hypothetical protein
VPVSSASSTTGSPSPSRHTTNGKAGRPLCSLCGPSVDAAPTLPAVSTASTATVSLRRGGKKKEEEEEEEEEERSGSCEARDVATVDGWTGEWTDG